MIRDLRRTVGAAALLAAGFPTRNRQAYGPGPGIRAIGLHAEDTDDFDRFRRFVDWCGTLYPYAGPEGVDRPADGSGSDAILLTLDDGHARTFRALEWLASMHLRITCFIIPSYVGRSVRQFLDVHAQRGVAAYNIGGERDLAATRGLEVSQLAELESMGHRLGAHNNAHRDLATLDDPGARYEIDEGIDALEQMLGHRVDDFAWAFGRADTVTPGSLAMMRRRCSRVYSCVRGLNVPSIPRRILMRDPVSTDFPAIVNKACIRGAFDHWYMRDRATLDAWSGSPATAR